MANIVPSMGNSAYSAIISALPRYISSGRIIPVFKSNAA
jgi:hypothetical protein